LIGTLPAVVLGRMAEEAAACYYEKKGYQVVARNYRAPRLGELDLVLERGGVLTFVEVKARRDAERFGGLPESITPAKLARMRKTAVVYMKENHLLNNDVSFLATLMNIDQYGQVISIESVPVEWI
jgi:putative endonuclease